jgi:hypothetical protein
MTSVWDEIEQTLTVLNSLPHNQTQLRGLSSQEATKRKVAEIRSGLASVIREDFLGPRLFLRVVSPTSRVYSGEWWFDAKIFDSLDSAYSRIYFSSQEKKPVLRDMLREILAISTEWNEISEIWALELPAGQTLRGYSGSGNPQKLFANLPLSSEGNRLLVGKARQVYFPVKNPLWVRHYQRFAA